MGKASRPPCSVYLKVVLSKMGLNACTSPASSWKITVCSRNGFSRCGKTGTDGLAYAAEAKLPRDGPVMMALTSLHTIVSPFSMFRMGRPDSGPDAYDAR